MGVRVGGLLHCAVGVCADDLHTGSRLVDSLRFNDRFGSDAFRAHGLVLCGLCEAVKAAVFKV